MASPTDWKSLHTDAFHRVRVLVTGGAGFIGSHIAEALLELGGDVVVLDNLVTGSRDNLTDLRGDNFVEGSILETSTLTRAAEGCRYIFHQAAAVSVFHSLEEPALFHEINGRGTINVLEVARRQGVQRVMFAASSSAYGDSETLPKVETMAPLPKSPYAATKVYGEALCRAYSGSFGIDTACLRYFNIFGPRQTPDSAYAAAIAAFAKAMLAGRTPTIYGDGEQSRDFTFVDNAVHANLLAARSEQPLHGEIINVGCGQRVSINELVKEMSHILGQPEVRAEHEPARSGDVKHSLADITRARQLLGYEPIVSFEQGLRQTMQWYRQVLKTG